MSVFVFMFMLVFLVFRSLVGLGISCIGPVYQEHIVVFFEYVTQPRITGLKRVDFRDIKEC
jgi:hypothetical protein